MITFKADDRWKLEQNCCFTTLGFTRLYNRISYINQPSDVSWRLLLYDGRHTAIGMTLNAQTIRMEIIELFNLRINGVHTKEDR